MKPDISELNQSDISESNQPELNQPKKTRIRPSRLQVFPMTPTVTNDGDSVFLSKCFMCDQEFTNRLAPRLNDALRSHIRHIHNRDECVKYDCSQCDYSTTRKPDLATHVEDKHTARTVTCGLCPKLFPTDRSLRRHQTRVHKPVALLNCDQCPTVVKSAATLKKHLKDIHSAVLSYSCDLCEKAYRTKGTLDAHVVTKHTDQTFPCDVCQKEFDSQKSAYHHKRRVHAPDEKIECSICKALVKPLNLRRHMQYTHVNGDVSYECDLCDKTYRRKSNLKRHKDTRHIIKSG